MKKKQILRLTRSWRACSLSLILLVSLSGPVRLATAARSTDTPPPGPTPKEIEVGDKASAEFEKSPKIKLLDGKKDPQAQALLDKLNKMAKELGQVSARPQIKYTVKVVEDTDMNAFTLPNGYIYIYRGLLDAVASDDELVAVLAHEIGHNARMHALRAEAKAKKLSIVNLAALAAMLAGGRSGANIAAFTQYLLLSVMNGYGVEYEKEADHAAIQEMSKIKYNPSAVVTLMQRLEQEEKRRPEVELGIFRTHPPSAERVTAAMADLQQMGIPYTPRDVQGGQQATVTEAADRAAVKLDAVTLIEFAKQPQQTPSAKDRAQQVAQQINQLLRANLKMHEISVNGNDNEAHLVARGIEIARITPADAKLQNLTPLLCAQKWRDNFRRIFWREAVNGKL